MIRIALIGFGEAAQAMASGLKDEPGVSGIAAHDIRFTDPTMGADLRARAVAAGISASADLGEAIDAADIVLSLVVGSAAVKVGEAAGRHMQAGQVFVDLNSISPEAKRRVGKAVAAGGDGDFVEGAVMARVPPYRHRVPILVAGARADRTAEMLNAAGMSVEPVGTEIGQACAVKMIRSVIVKGVEALLIESLTAAEKAGVRERILDSIGGTFPGVDWRETAAYYIGRTHQHGPRRVTEMKEAAATLEELGLEPLLSRAIADTIAAAHARLVAAKLPSGVPYPALLAALAGGPETSPENAE